jgi:prepilin-type N-terminal cleavage/methylation domain-containing protein
MKKEKQKQHISFSQSGFTFIEILISIAILAIIATAIIGPFASFRNAQAIKNTSGSVVALLNQARVKTLSSENLLQYGVHLQSDRAILFSGTSYNAGVSISEVVVSDSKVAISDIALAGGDDVVFDRLTGATDNYGTLVVTLTDTSEGQKTITIAKTGVVSSN